VVLSPLRNGLLQGKKYSSFLYSFYCLNRERELHRTKPKKKREPPERRAKTRKSAK